MIYKEGKIDILGPNEAYGDRACDPPAHDAVTDWLAQTLLVFMAHRRDEG